MTWARLSRKAREERGFLLVEVVVSTVLLTIGVLTLISVLDSSRDLVSLSERRETALHQAELELERVRALDFASLALPSAPSASGNPNDPGYRVQSGSYRWQLNPVKANTLVVDATTCALPSSQCPALETAFQDGRLTGEIHRYVTSVDEDNNGVAEPTLRRVTVAVTLDQGTARPPVVLSTIIRRNS